MRVVSLLFLIFLVATGRAIADRDQTLFQLAAGESLESVSLFLQALQHSISKEGDGRVTQTTPDGESLLHLSCIRGQPEKIAALLAANADPNYR